MNRWSAYLFGDVAAVRPLLLARGFLALFAFDLLVDFLPRAHLYGAGGFDVAHFRWLDAIQPTPTPALYVCLILAAAFATLTCAVVGIRRWLIAVACVCYGYAYFMSQHDTYQHHYLLLIMLIVTACFPRIDAASAIAPPDDDNPAPPRISAWAYTLLAVQVAIVYLWTAIAKFDGAWLSGHTVRRIVVGADEARLADSPVAIALDDLGAWPVLAIGAIVMELLLVAACLWAPTLDRRTPTRRVRWLAFGAWLLAAMLHGGIFTMPLQIGLFSFYMLMLATVILLPIDVVAPLGRIVTKPLLAIGRVWDRLIGSGSIAGLAIAAVVAGVALGAAGYLLDVPGGRTAVGITAGIFVALAAVTYARTGAADATRCALAGLVFAALLSGVVHFDALPHHIWAALARERQLAGDGEAADALYRRAIDHRSDDGVFYAHYAEHLAERGRTDDAVAAYERGMNASPPVLAPFTGYANFMLERNRPEVAARAYANAVAIEPSSAILRFNHGLALQLSGQIDAAIDAYKSAVAIDPDHYEAHNNLATVLIARKRLADAVEPLRAVIRIQPDNVTAMNNLARVHVTNDEASDTDLAEAIALARGAAELTRREEPTILSTLAEAYYRSGEHREAIRIAREGIAVANRIGHGAALRRLESRLRAYESAEP